MKNQLFAITATLFLGFFILQSCSDDDGEVTIPNEIVVGDRTFDLDNSNFYLVRKRTGNDWTYSDYAFSDGVYQKGSNIFRIESYENATYCAIIELAVRSGEEVTIGNYPQYTNWGTAADDPANLRISYVYIENNDDTYFQSISNLDIAGHEPVKVTGGLQDGNEMSISLTSNFEDGNDVIYPCSIVFTGIVDDVTD